MRAMSAGKCLSTTVIINVARRAESNYNLARWRRSRSSRLSSWMPSCCLLLSPFPFSVDVRWTCLLFVYYYFFSWTRCICCSVYAMLTFGLDLWPFICISFRREALGQAKVRAFVEWLWRISRSSFVKLKMTSIFWPHNLKITCLITTEL